MNRCQYIFLQAIVRRANNEKLYTTYTYILLKKVNKALLVLFLYEVGDIPKKVVE